ncbi:hypothetical protein [Methylobacter sp. sgz302048]|uniref:hypothetical protein n=1 Tax=Methylobacter sp. sgz302048 TaxID=3455945 RepID=UPI003FA173EB
MQPRQFVKNPVFFIVTDYCLLVQGIHVSADQSYRNRAINSEKNTTPKKIKPAINRRPKKETGTTSPNPTWVSVT